MKVLKILTACLIVSLPLSIQAQTLSDAFDISTSGIIAQRLKMTLGAENVANGLTTKDEETGLPYQKKFAVLEAAEKGVRVSQIDRSTEPFSRYFDPAVPQSDEDGYFYLPNINLPDEMIRLKFSETLFEANVNTFKLTKSMYQTATEIMK